ncbi:hypothetical protein CYLTODRAFT_382951, partial [Cylindrobasidium torrendii FP15055 ss-10]
MFAWLESIIQHDYPPGAKWTTHRPKECLNAVLGRPPHPDDANFDTVWPQYVRDVLDASGQRHTHNDTCFKKLKLAMGRLSPKERDELCRFNLPAETRDRTVMDEEGAILPKRTDPMMCGHNTTTSAACQCNTDTKFVGSGWVGMAMSVYMSSYTAKATIESAIVLSALAAAIEAAELKGDQLTDEIEQSRLVLRRTLNIMVGRRELSGQQVAA